MHKKIYFLLMLGITYNKNYKSVNTHAGSRTINDSKNEFSYLFKSFNSKIILLSMPFRKYYLIIFAFRFFIL